MRRSGRALSVIVIGVLATTMTVTATAGSAAPARASVAASAASASSSVSSGDATPSDPLSTHDLEVRAVDGEAGRMAVALDPGASMRRTFVVTNRTSGLRLTVRMGAVDATTDAAGAVRYAADAKPGKPGTWLTLSDVVATLEPKAELRVSVQVTVPASAEPGHVAAGLVVGIDRAVRIADELDAERTDPITLPVSIDVKGAATALVSIARVVAVKDGDDEFLEITFQNGGATANTMVGNVKVLGSQPHTESVRAEVAPLTHTVVRVPFAMPSGKKSVPVEVTTDDSGGNQAAWNGNVGYESEAQAPPPAVKKPAARPKATASDSGGSALPRPAVAVVVLVFMLAAAWFVSELRRSRRRKIAAPSVAVQPLPGAGTPLGAGAPAPSAPVMAAAAVAPDHFGQLATQIGSLVEAIERLVDRLGPVAPSAPVPPVVAPSAPTPTPTPTGAGASPAESGAILYTPAASAPAAEAFDPYDWPTAEQLDQFIARRHDTRTDPL